MVYTLLYINLNNAILLTSITHQIYVINTIFKLYLNVYYILYII